MLRKQLYIEEELDRGLKVLSARTGRSEADHVRTALRHYLAEQLPAPKRDPLLRLIGMVADAEGPDDVAEEHDRYLYGSS